MQVKNYPFLDEFHKETCDYCGLCFHKCPVLKLPLKTAQREIKKLVELGRSPTILNRCTSCMACNYYCPQNCNPYALILSSWYKRYLRNGLPYRARLALPYHFPNLYTITMKKLPKDEQLLINQWHQNWKNPQGHETMLYTGCNLLLQPFLLKSKIFENVPIFGSLELCCGEPLYRMGCLHAVKIVGLHLQQQFEQMGFKELIMPCLGGYHMFSEVYPKLYGIEFDFKVISLIDWLWNLLQKDKFDIIPIKKKAVLHDNCWAKASGKHFFNRVRELLATLDVTILEPEHTRENALCCGIGAAAANYSILYTFKNARTRLKELLKVKPDFAVNYCGGCNWYLNIAKKLISPHLPLYHLIEVLQLGIGETPLHRTNNRAQTILSSTLPRGLPHSFRLDRFHIKKILNRDL
ncbi:MAG: (Fe-S)-binding protein [Candidatus Helarchaeota archaeon]